MTETAQLAQSLIGSAAVAPIADRAFLRITGPDATRWLNGMVTNHVSIQSLAPGEGNYNFLLNAQGRIQGDCTIYRDSAAVQDNYILETSTDQIESIRQLLDKFIIMDDVEMQVEFAQLQGLLILGNAISVTKLLADIHATGKNPMGVAQTNPAHGFVLLPRILHKNDVTYQYEIWATSTQPWLEKLSALNIPEVSPATLESLRILSATPKYGTDIRNTDLPQETAQTHALHFAKGCYLGQEIVERIRSRGQVHRTFTQFTLTGDLPTLPAPLTANEKPAGELTSAARIGDKIFALGYIRREILESHQPVTYPGGTAVPRT